MNDLIQSLLWIYLHLLLHENKEYKDFKDKNVSDIYIWYRQLFGDSYDCDKCATTSSLMCRMGLVVLEDSAVDDHLDVIPVDGEESNSSDEGAVEQV